jgi:hypothetical protein
LLLAVNITTSGCPFLPSSIGCISVDWSVGTDAAARIQTEFFQFNHASRHNQVFPLTLAAAIASLLCIPRLRSPFLGHCLGICWVGITFLLVVAPVPRYGLGYFLLPVAAGSACILDWLDTRIDLTLPAIARRFWSVPGASMLFAPAILFAALAVLVLRGWGLGEFLYPRRLASASGDPIHIVNRVLDANGRLLLRQENRGSLTVWVPVSSDQCWDAPLPCTPTLTRDSVSLRRPGSLEAGFVGHQGQD